MTGSGEILRDFYAAVSRRDFAQARRFLADDMVSRVTFRSVEGSSLYE